MEMEMEMLMELPIEIATNILSRLPFDSVIQFKCLSKYWYNLLQLLIHSGEFHFAQNHRSRLMENYTFLRYSYTNNFRGDDGSDDAFYDSSCESDIYEYPCSSFSPSSLPDSVLLMLYDDDDDESTTFHYADYYEDQKGLFNCKAVKKLNYPLPLDMINISSDDSWTLSASSNGLVCSLVYNRSTNTNSSSYLFCIFNPFLGEYVTLPDDEQHMISSCTIAFGFSHIPSTNEYKLVRIVYPDTPDGGCGDVGNIQVYTLGCGGKWRSKGIIKRRLLCDTPGVLVNGSLHWLTENERWKKLKRVRGLISVEQEAEFMQKIMVFDLLQEEFDHMIEPPPAYYTNLRIKEWGGYLCGFNSTDELRVHDTWKFFMYEPLLSKNKMIVDGEWKKIVSLEWHGGKELMEPYENLYFYNKGNQALLWTTYISKRKRESYKSNSLVVAVKMDDLRGSHHKRELHAAKLFHGIFHIKSFVSLKVLGENNTKRIIDDDRKRKQDNNNNNNNKDETEEMPQVATKKKS